MRTLVFLLLICEAAAQRTSRQRAGAPGADLDILNTAVATFDGTLRALDKKHAQLEMSEEQSLSIEVTRKTLYFRGTKAIASRDIPVGTVVTVEAKKIANQLVAVSVRVKEPQPDSAR
jgi:hypothetical protein